MVKPLVDFPPPLKKESTGRILMTRYYELITPLFGGGVKGGEVDEDQPIRGTSIRGQLRFWWRATRGGRFDGNLKQMKQAEDEIWGTTGTGTKVSIAVTECTLGRSHVARDRGKEVNVGDPASPLGYVAFPLRDSGGKVYDNVSFTLRIDCPKTYRPDLKAALWAWETFGGIGARTRRGFGALHCTDVQLYIDQKKYNAQNWIWAYPSANTKEAILEYLAELASENNFPRFVTHCSLDTNRTHTTPAQLDAYSTWLELINSLKNFRQNRNPNERNQPYSRSRWPEPDAIRDLTGQSLKSRGHDIPVYTPPIYKFPRAAFGLPIIFEFKDDDDQNPTNPDKDPRKTELKGDGYDRRASRLILRPLKCNDGRYVGLATILQGQTIPPGGLQLNNSPRNPAAKAEELTVAEARQISTKHANYNGATDVLQAFLNQLPR